MPSKKKKYNARFPPARIKKIMQTDEDVGKVAAAVPVIISRALELFIDSLIEKTAAVTRAKNAKTLSSSHIKQAIQSEKTFDFLQDLVKNVPDHQTEEEIDSTAPSGSGTVEKKQKVPRPRKPREEGARGPGRPRKVKVEEKKESASEPSDEETETDEEQTADEDSSNTSQSNHAQASGAILSPAGQFGLPAQTQISPGMCGPAIGNSIPSAPLSHAPVMSSAIPSPQITSVPHILSSPRGPSVNPPVTNMPGDQPLFSAQYPTPAQGQPLMSPGQQQQGVPKVPAGFPMHNMGYPFMAGGLPVPFLHPQTSVDHQLATNANMHAAYTQSRMQQYPPPHFLPPHTPYMMSPMESNDPHFMGPSRLPGMPMGPPPPLFPLKQNQLCDSGDASMPLDMSLAGKSRLPSTSSESTSSSDRPPVSDSADSELSRLPHPPGLPQWNVNNRNNQNMMDLSKSQMMGPPPLVGSAEDQSNNSVNENGRHVQSNPTFCRKPNESKSSRNPSDEKTVSFPGLANIMNMRPVKTIVSEDNDDDYDS